MIIHKDGSMFDDPAHDCLVNTINCYGAMGAGIALEFKNRFPDMFEHYRLCCEETLIAPGDAWRFEQNENLMLVGLAVKHHWKYKARFSWAKMAVRNFVNDLIKGVVRANNIAIPKIGGKNGGRGANFPQASDNWPNDAEAGYKLFEPFLLSELGRCPDKTFTIYSLPEAQKELL